MPDENPELDMQTLRLFYQDYIDRIRDTKQQQWHLTYYTVLLYAGLVGIDKLAGKDSLTSSVANHVISITAIVIGLASVMLLIYFQHELRRRRTLMESMSRELWPDETKKAFGEAKTNYVSPTHQWPLLALKIAVTMAGAAFTVWLVWMS